MAEVSEGWVFYLNVLHQQGDVGELGHLGRRLQDLGHHLAPLAETMQRVLENLPQACLALRGQTERPAFQTAMENKDTHTHHGFLTSNNKRHYHVIFNGETERESVDKHAFKFR